ncbi:hypothetical protein [Streptomyces chumphonensis]|uniref:hypothetical protein n=1 Tax=Streptomyces chumphonensis TaxID=1214925 RepID=UPI003D72B623
MTRPDATGNGASFISLVTALTGLLAIIGGIVLALLGHTEVAQAAFGAGALARIEVTIIGVGRTDRRTD